jgi:predicted amidohydrolase
MRRQPDAADRVEPLGHERSLQDPDGLFIRFYGGSFIADATGAKLAEAAEEGDDVLIARFDLRPSKRSAATGACSATGGPISTAR